MKKISFVLLLILTSCTNLPTATDTFKLEQGMSEEQVSEIMGKPTQRLPDRLLYTVEYACTKVPFYVVMQMGFVVKYGAGVNTTRVEKMCAEQEQMRAQRMLELQRGAQLMQTQFGPGASQPQQPMEPLMRNCWSDAAGTHCM